MTSWLSAILYLLQKAVEALAAWQEKQTQNQRQAQRDAIEANPADAMAEHFMGLDSVRRDARRDAPDKANAKRD